MGHNYAGKILYTKKIMEQNAQNPNITPEQHAFLEKLASYRHLLHSSPQQYFYNTRKTHEIDQFFAAAASQQFFLKLGLPFPNDMLNSMQEVRNAKDMQFENFDEAVERFAFMKELNNSIIEIYLQHIDAEKGTSYCPTGNNRENVIDPISLTEAKLRAGRKVENHYQEQMRKKLERIDKVPEQKLINSHTER